MIVEKMEQGSLEWHEHRAQYRNASEAAIIMDCAPAYWKTSKRILWEQKQGLRGSSVDANNPAILHGNNMEAAALACFNKNFNANAAPVVGVNGLYSGSLDGHGTDREGRSLLVEIKCPWRATSSEVWRKAASGEIASYYFWQMVHQQYVVPVEQAFFFVYISDDQFIVLPHIATEEDTAALLAAWDDFSASEPEADFVEMEDEHMKVLVTEHQALISQQKHLKAQLDQVETVMKARAGNDNVLAFGCKIQTIERKGSVDYKQIETLQDVDLEQYRKPPSKYQKISYLKKEA